MPEDLVSIIIPVFNGADHVGEAIESALSQSWREIEVIVVDDGSKDDGATRRAISRFGTAVRLIAQENGGVGAALNAGVAAMRGSWFAWLSHDDVYHPERIARHASALMPLPVPMISFGDVDFISADGTLIGHAAHTEGFADDRTVGNGAWAVLEGRLNGCTMLVPRVCIEEAGGFDTSLPTTQDYALWHRLAQRYPFVPVPGALVRQRQSDKQGSRTARHIEEASLLWLGMLEHLDAQGGTRHERLQRLRRADAFLRRSPYLGAQLFVERQLRAAMDAFGVDMLLRAPTDGADVGRAVTLVAASGARLGRLTATDERPPRVPAASLTSPLLGLADVIVRVGETATADALLDVAAEGGDAPLVAVVDARSLPDAQTFADALRVVASAEADACIGEASAGPPIVAVSRAMMAARAPGAPGGLPAGARVATAARPGRPPVRFDPEPERWASPQPNVQGRPQLARMPDPGRPTLLFLLHSWGGGTVRYADIVAAALGDRVNLLFGCGVEDRMLQLSSLGPEQPEVAWSLEAGGLDHAVSALRSLGVGRVDVLHTIGLDRWIEPLLDALGVPFDVTLLDYHMVANGPHLLDERSRFVGDTALARPDHPARRRGPPRLLLRAAQRRIACSHDLARRASWLSGLPIIAAEVPEPASRRRFAIHAPPLSPGETLRVLCLGRFAPHKGADDIVAAARVAEARGLDVQFLCLGEEDGGPLPLDLQARGRIRLLGGFADAMLNPMVCLLRPHLAWLPFRAPETYSFALSDCMQQGLPVLATGIGAIPERVEGRPATWLIHPDEGGAETVVAWLERLVEDRLQTPPRWLPTGDLPPLMRGYYERDYLAWT